MTTVPESRAADERTGRGDDSAGAVAMLRAMLLVRAFERRLMALPGPGFQLLSAGEEAVAAGLAAALGPRDTLLTGGRSIGPALARGLDPGAVMAEVLGKVGGPCRGRGGRGHLAQPSAGFFGAHAVVGGNLSVAAGVALAFSTREPAERGAVACLFGDGACGSGALHETLNLAALWRLPLVLVCNNNQYSISTPVAEGLAPRALADLAAPFGVPGLTVDGMDAVAVRDAALEMTARARAGGGPSFLECVSYRYATHSTATRETRPEGELARWRARCPIGLLADRLQSEGALDREGLAVLEAEAEARVDRAARWAVESADPDPSEVLDGVD